MSLPLDDIQRAVCAWHNRHPLAQRIVPEAVHSVGWVALPYMRAAQAQEPSLDAPESAQAERAPATALPGRMQRLLQGLRPGAWARGPGPWPVFSEAFIERLSPQRVAAFAATHAWASPVDNGSGWPQRRIEVDAARAEACHGAWPTERWLIAAAVDHQGQRLRVLVGENRGRLAVLGARRHPARVRWLLAGLALALLAGLALWRLWPAGEDAGPLPPARHASGVVPAVPQPPASSPASAVAVVAAPASAPASEPAAPASAAASAPLAASAPGAAPASEPASEPAASASPQWPPDIRPRLGPVRKTVGPRTPREALQAKPPLRSQREGGASASAPAASGPYRGARDPEQLRLAATADGPLVALVSPGFASRAEAEAQLARMREHVQATVRDAGALQGEVFDTPQGWRAAVWPFGTREEAQIVNATMVVRGWKTRAIDF